MKFHWEGFKFFYKGKEDKDIRIKHEETNLFTASYDWKLIATGKTLAEVQDKVVAYLGI